MRGYSTPIRLPTCGKYIICTLNVSEDRWRRRIFLVDRFQLKRKKNTARFDDVFTWPETWRAPPHACFCREVPLKTEVKGWLEEADWCLWADRGGVVVSMSWVRAVPRSDDVFDEDVDELSLQNKEWRCSMEKRAKVSQCLHADHLYTASPGEICPYILCVLF